MLPVPVIGPALEPRLGVESVAMALGCPREEIGSTFGADCYLSARCFNLPREEEVDEKDIIVPFVPGGIDGDLSLQTKQTTYLLKSRDVVSWYADLVNLLFSLNAIHLPA